MNAQPQRSIGTIRTLHQHHAAPYQNAGLGAAQAGGFPATAGVAGGGHTVDDDVANMGAKPA